MSQINEANFSCYEYFKKALKILPLKEFPCGLGSWRNPECKKVDEMFTVTTADYGANYEKIETLLDYINNWDSSDISWSNEAKELMKISVLEPHKFQQPHNIPFIFTFIKSLYFRDKNINLIDEEMKKFRNLQELVLSANYLTEINSYNLPNTLQVLELGSNQIYDLSSLCLQPPHLLHLGLSYNRLSNNQQTSCFFIPHLWPHLKSLDLSFNDFDQLSTTVAGLQSLPSLKSLALQGNPLSLLPNYRRYVINALKNLSHLDDVIISADERHYSSVETKENVVCDEAQLIVKIGGVYGAGRNSLPMASSDAVVTTEYYVSYTMLEDGGSDVTNHLSESKPGSDVIDFNYTKIHKVKDLKALRDLLMNGIEISVIGKTIRWWPVDEASIPATGKKKKPKSAKNEKRKKKNEEELREGPPELDQLGGYKIMTDDLVRGEWKMMKICYCGGGEKPSEEDQIKLVMPVAEIKESEVKKKKKKKEKEEKKKETEEMNVKRPLLIHITIQLDRYHLDSELNK